MSFVNSFINNLTNNSNRLSTTENGATTLKSTLDSSVDFFFKVGSARQLSTTNEQELINLFINSYDVSKKEALRILFYMRDIRGGQGERNAFKVILKNFIYKNFYKLDPKTQRKAFRTLFELCREFGRVDDYIDTIQAVNYMLRFDSNYNRKLNKKEVNTFINMSVSPIVNIINKYIISMFDESKSTRSSIFNDIKRSVNTLNITNISMEDRLLFKWIPRQDFITRIIHNKLSQDLNKKFINLIGFKKTRIKNQFNNQALLFSRTEFRKLLVRCSDTTEQKVQKKEYDLINLEKISSLTMKRHMTNFRNNIPERIDSFFKALQKGEAKVNSSTLYPYDVYNTLNISDDLANAQWDNLPNYFENLTDLNILPVIDVSGSMESTFGLTQSPMSIAITLGMYLAERNTSAYKNKFITFEDHPSLIDFSAYDTFSKRAKFIKKASWGGSTNLFKTFELIVDAYKYNNITANDIPKAIIIFSDMEFNQCDRYTNFESIQKLYKDNNIEMPKLIFWNIASRTKNNFPVTYNEKGVMLVGGFSPSTLKSIIKLCSGELIEPNDLMNEVIMNERYNKVDKLLKFVEI